MNEVPIISLGAEVRHVGNGKKGEVVTLPGKRTYFNSGTRQLYVKWNGGGHEWVDSLALEEC